MLNTTDAFYIVSIDPGSNTGIAVFEIGCAEFNIISILTNTVVLDRYIRSTEHKLLARNRFLSWVCDNLYRLYNPNVVAMESAFLNSKFPLAVTQLSQYTSTIEQSFYNNNNFIKLYKYPPKYIKKYIGGGGGANKMDMLTAVQSVQELSGILKLDRLTEHEIDAVAIGYITLVGLRNTPHELISC